MATPKSASGALCVVPPAWFVPEHLLVDHLKLELEPRRKAVDAYESLFDPAIMCRLGLIHENRLRRLDCPEIVHFLPVIQQAKAGRRVSAMSPVPVTSLHVLYKLLLIHEIFTISSAESYMRAFMEAITSLFDRTEIGTTVDLARRRKDLVAALTARSRDAFVISEFVDGLAQERAARRRALIGMAADIVRALCTLGQTTRQESWFAATGWMCSMATTVIDHALRITSARMQARLAENDFWSVCANCDTDVTKREHDEDLLDAGVRWLVDELHALTQVAVAGYEQG